MTQAYERFLDSMKMDYMKWHEGIGYDLAALHEVTADERKAIEDLLIAGGCRDWRDVDALAEIASPRAMTALEGALKSAEYEVRIRATEKLVQKGLIDERKIETVLVETLPLVTILNGMVFTLRLAEKYPTLAVRRVLLRLTLQGNNDIRVHAAALLYYLYGLAASTFDWDHRPLFLRFGEKDPEKRRAAYLELCENIHVDPAWALDQGK